MTGGPLPVVSDRAMGIELAAIVAVSVGVLTIPDRTAWMSALVAAAFVGRTLAWATLPRKERGPVSAELVFLAVCTLAGGFNDWNSVVRHGVYDYTVAVWWPEASTIPLWMLAFWGLILRSVYALTRWSRLGPPEGPVDTVHVGGRAMRSAALKVGVLLTLTLVTRQCIYRLWDDPWLSFLPFAAALLAYVALCRPGRHDGLLVGVFLAVGPAVEVLYIGIGGLHRYEHGVLAGVPVWIALWWLLAVLVWKDLGARLHGGLIGGVERPPRFGGARAPRRVRASP